ncbi:hypothetical protein OKW50_000874 [Paraburkholderia youngii]
MDSSLIQTIAVYALPVIFAITLHEAAHGYVARWLGDNTAYVLGRVSLNPMRHIDPLGTIAIPLLLYFATSGAFMFGYAKPVPVAFGNLRNPRWGSLWVAAAGPVCNFVQALLWGVLGIVLAVLNVNEPFFTRMAGAARRRQSRARRAEPVSSAAARWRTRGDGPVAAEAIDRVVAARTVRLFHRDGARDDGYAHAFLVEATRYARL